MPIFFETLQAFQHASKRDWISVIFSLIITELSSCFFEKGAYHEGLHMFCIVSLKLPFFSTMRVMLYCPIEVTLLFNRLCVLYCPIKVSVLSNSLCVWIL